MLPTNSRALAQEPTEPTAPVATEAVQPEQPVQAPAAQQESGPLRQGEIVDEDGNSPTENNAATLAHQSTNSTAAQPTNALPLIPTIANAPNIPTTVALTVSVQPTVRASEYITYIVSYRNTGTTAPTSLFLDAIWLNFSYSEGGAISPMAMGSDTVLQPCNPIKVASLLRG